MRKSRATYFPPVESAGAREAIVRRIGELITAGELRTGDRLPPEPSLATSFGVAPMTVRAALQTLRDHGFLETRRGRGGGTFVRADAVAVPLARAADRPARTEFEDFTTWRVAVSGEAAARAAHRFADAAIGVEEAARLRALADRSHLGGLSSAEARVADAEFHLYIAELADSPRLVEAERSIQSQLTQILIHLDQRPRPSAVSGQSHASLQSAIVAGRVEQARADLRVHVQSTVDLLVGIGVLV